MGLQDNEQESPFIYTAAGDDSRLESFQDQKEQERKKGGGVKKGHNKLHV